MPEVKTISYSDEKRIVKELKSKGFTEAINYIRALKNVIEMQNETIEVAKGKINQLIKLDKE